MRRYLLAICRAVCLASIVTGVTSLTIRGLGIGAATGATSTTNTKLKIAKMRITEGANRTVITAFDSAKAPVAKLELVHGRFVPTEYPELRQREVEGRKLFVEVNGQVITWETIGFTDTSRMPALPSNLDQVTSFLSDERVRRVLEKWRIGWMPGPASVARTAAALLFTDFVVFGTNPRDISGLFTAGSVRNFPINTCANNGAVAPDQGWIIASHFADEEVVSQCCPVSPTLPAFFGVKACSRTTNVTSCGVAAAACKACPGSPQLYSTSCSVSLRSAGSSNAAGEQLFFVDHCVDGVPSAPPTITVGPSIEIWPPNHEMRAFRLADLATAADPCNNSVDLNANGTITSITSNEPGSDNYTITGSSSFQVRAERNGSGNSRIYEIRFTVSNGSGTSEPAVAIVRVPRDQG
jgi:hypothetical protein